MACSRGLRRFHITRASQASQPPRRPGLGQSRRAHIRLHHLVVPKRADRTSRSARTCCARAVTRACCTASSRSMVAPRASSSRRKAADLNEATTMRVAGSMMPLTETSPIRAVLSCGDSLPSSAVQPFRGSADSLRPVGFEQDAKCKEVRSQQIVVAFGRGVFLQPFRHHGVELLEPAAALLCPTGHYVPLPTLPSRPPPPAHRPDPATAVPCRRKRCLPRVTASSRPVSLATVQPVANKTSSGNTQRQKVREPFVVITRLSHIRKIDHGVGAKDRPFSIVLYGAIGIIVTEQPDCLRRPADLYAETVETSHTEQTPYHYGPEVSHGFPGRSLFPCTQTVDRSRRHLRRFRTGYRCPDERDG